MVHAEMAAERLKARLSSGNASCSICGKVFFCGKVFSLWQGIPFEARYSFCGKASYSFCGNTPSHPAENASFISFIQGARFKCIMLIWSEVLKFDMNVPSTGGKETAANVKFPVKLGPMGQLVLEFDSVKDQASLAGISVAGPLAPSFKLQSFLQNDTTSNADLYGESACCLLHAENLDSLELQGF